MRFSSIEREFPPSYNGRHVKGKIRWLKWRRTLSRQLVVTMIRNDYFSRLRPQLLTRSSSPSWMIFSLSYARVCRTDEKIYRRVGFWSAEIPLIIGANCSDSFISSFDSAELIFAVVSNHIDPRRSVLAAIQLLWFHSIITTDGPRQKKSSSSGLPEPRSTT